MTSRRLVRQPKPPAASAASASSASPAADAPAPVPWARQPVRSEPPVTNRFRRQVDNLPDWDPLPPGEILVQRGGPG